MCNIPSGKGERFIMLTGISKEYGMLAGANGILDSLMLFQAKKATGDYHDNMDSAMFCMWLSKQLLPLLDAYGIQAILVMDNASYHLCPAEGSLITKSMTTKTEISAILNRYNVPYREGRARADGTGGDNLEQLRHILDNWLLHNAIEHNILVGVTKVQQLCTARGHYPPLLTPPYHPELQPIEDLWRDVKQLVARQYLGGRTMSELKEHIMAAFERYGTAAACAGKIKEALDHERRYREEGIYAPVIDLTLVNDPDDNDMDDVEYVSENDDDSDDDM